MNTPLPKLIRRTGQLLLILSLATLIGLGWYGYKRGFTRRWRESVFEEFRRHGIEITFRKLTLDPFRGLVAREVTLFDTTDRRRTIAQIDQAILNVDLSRFARGRPFLTALELRDTRLSLPLSPENPTTKRLEVQNLSARLFFPNKQVQLTQASAKVLGCRIRAQGWIANPNALPDKDASGQSRVLQAAQAIIETLQTLRLKEESPLVRIQFSGDMFKPESLRATVQISAEDFEIHNVPLTSLECSATWRENALELRDLTIDDTHGTLRASGRWDPLHETMDFQCESSLDPTKCATAFGFAKATQKLTWSTPPSLQLQLHRDASTPIRIAGFVSAQNFSYNGEAFEKASAYGSYQPGKWSVRELSVQHRAGSLSANCLSTPEELHVKVSSTLPIDVVNNILPSDLPYPASSLSAIRSSEPTSIEITIDRSAPEPIQASGTGSIHLEKGSIYGFPIERIVASIQLSEGLLELKANDAKTLGGTTSLTGAMNIPPKTPGHKMALEFSGLQFGEVARLWSPKSGSGGTLSGSLHWDSANSTVAQANGQAHFHIIDANLLSLPQTESLKRLLSSIVPEVEKSTKQQGSASFEIHNGVLSTTDLRIHTPAISLQSKGSLSLTDGSLTLSSQFHTREHPDKSIEFVTDGGIQKPRWRKKTPESSTP